DRRGLIYVGNGDGVLEFDGVRWRLIRTTSGTVVLSLAVDPGGRVYVGADTELGYLEPDEAGQARFVSLLDRLPVEHRDVGSIRRTFVTKEGVTFASSKRLYRFAGK